MARTTTKGGVVFRLLGIAMILSGTLPFLYRLYLAAPVLLGSGLSIEFVLPYAVMVITGLALLVLSKLAGSAESKHS